MTEFIFTLILMFSLSFVLYLTVRALPRVAEEPAQDRKGFLDRWAHSHIPEKIDATFNSFLLKFLSRIKIVVLKLDNTIGRQLRKMRTHGVSKKPGIDFKDMAETKEDNIKN